MCNNRYHIVTIVIYIYIISLCHDLKRFDGPLDPWNMNTCQFNNWMGDISPCNTWISGVESVPIIQGVKFWGTDWPLSEREAKNCI